jgi:iron-sulfur cluster assembly protein
MSEINAIEILPPITLSAAALTHVKHQIARRGGGCGLRLGIKKMGCSGLGYTVEIIDEPGAEDHVFPQEPGLAVYVAPGDLSAVQGTQIDFVRQGLNREFRFNNPNIKDTCGCGESFSV